ncbi:transport and Golgi organization protein 1 isoform X1 [Bombus vosnesenskii]|uniref:Transport and Golgi organization protein 1 isoform X1 n=1 Tax=Bombus vosnesenskii TaxID=207650 RepID=A0A6J3KE73_9HYME|nr:transport and Golgi organization protein 1 isoform X1 [Bombus vosnesenskii]
MLVVMWNCSSTNMTERNLFINVLFLVIAIIFNAIPQCSSVLSDKRLCYDPDCSEPVSLARTTIRYTPNEAGLLSCNINEKVTVYSKEAGKRSDLWGVEINGRHGYIPKTFLKEYKILHKNLEHEVSIDPLFSNVSSNEKLQSKKNKNKSVFDKKDIKTSSEQIDNLELKSLEELPQSANGINPSYEIIDGTTVHLDINKPSEPTFIKEVIQTTVVPNEQDADDEILNNNLESKEHTISAEVDFKDFVTSSEKILDLPEISGVQSSPLNISITSDKVEYIIENVENKSVTNVEGDQFLDKVIDINSPQTSTSDGLKETLTIEGEEAVELNKEGNVSPSESDVNNNTTSDVQNVRTIDQIEEVDIQPLQNVRIDTTNKTQLDIQNAESFDQIQTKDIQSSQNITIVTTSDARLDAQNAENSDKVETENIHTSSVEMIVVNETESNIQNTENSGKVEKEDVNSSANIELFSLSNIKSDIQNAENSDQIETKDIQALQNVTIVTTSDTKSDVQSEENSDKVDIKNIPLLENIIPRIKDTRYLGSVMQIQTEPDDAKKEEESKNIEDLNEHDTSEYKPFSFIESNVNNEVLVTLPTHNIETKDIQFDLDIETEEGSTLDTKSNSNIENTVSVKEITDIQYNTDNEDALHIIEETSENIFHEVQASVPDVCTADNIGCPLTDNQNNFPHHEQPSQGSENALMSGIQIESNYWLALMYLSVTATATLIFSLGYYCIENMRSDRQLIVRINKLEKDLLISEAECTMVNENLKSTKEKLSRMEDESFGSDEMVLSLRADLEASQNAKTELEDQVAMLEKDLESATEAGLELEKMLREVLSANNEVNPLAQSVEDLQTRLNAQQAANESLTNAVNLKTQENESISAELVSVKKKYEELEVELARLTENLKQEINSKNNIEQTWSDKVQQLEMEIKEISTEKTTLQKELKAKEVEANDLVDVINRLNSNNLDLDKLYDVSHIKVEATALLEERNELKIRLAEIEGAHNLLEEHVKFVKEEVATLGEQCKVAEKEKKDAETRLEVLTNFFEEKEAHRQKEEAIWLQQQGEVVSTVERIQTMQNEIQNYKQQIEVLKREILDQEREYKNQISVLETKAHEQWVIARQVERRLEESKVEAGQLRNRLTLIEKNINDVDSEAKLHRLEANGETTTSPPLFIGAESSSSPIMFSGSSSVPPPPPPSYLHSLFPPYLPPPLPNTSGVPPYEVSQRPPPLGGRLSSPPPMPLHPPAPNRYDNAGSPPPMSPHLLPPFNHRSPPPPPFASDIHPPPPPPPGSILPPPLGTPHSWGEESLPPPRSSGFHPAQRERVRNHKGRKRFSKVRQFWSTMEGNNCK